MSHKVVTLVYSKRVGSAHRKAILAYCADRASDDGRGVYCSKGTIAEETEIARSTVFKTIKELVAEGVLIEAGTRACRNGHTVVYDMNLDAIRGYQDAATSPLNGPVRSVTSPPAGPHQSAERTPTSPPAGPKPSLEPSLNLEPPLAPKRRQSRTEGIDQDAAMSKSQAEIALKVGISLREAEAQFERFKGNAIANGKRFASWDAAWRNWLQSPFFKPLTGDGNATASHQSGKCANGPQNRPDPALEQIFRLSGYGQASGHGGA